MIKTSTRIDELYLCEKPSQARDIAKVLGTNQRNDGYLLGSIKGKTIVVTWCIGHLLEMQTPDAYDQKFKRWSLADLPILPAQWKMIGKKSTKKQLTIIKNLLKKTQSVVIATDADREGETIAREVLDFAKYKNAKRRLWLSALDHVSIKRALSTIKSSSETEPLYYSGLARSRADWLTGMNLTRYFTLLGQQSSKPQFTPKSSFSKKKGAKTNSVRSVGRVQTPTLALITRRDQEILNFVPMPYYEIFASFISHDDSRLLETKWIVPENISQSHNEKKYCLDKKQAQQVIERCENQVGLVESAYTQRKKQPPPLLYNLSGLQQEGSRRWGYGAQEILNIAQSLYETHKLTTYPRSDCEYLPLSQFSDVASVLSGICKNDQSIIGLVKQANQKQRSRAWNDKKITAHHAIIPTQAIANISALSIKELNLYNLIKRRYIAQFFPDYEYDQSTILLSINSGQITDQFKASGRIARIQGWKKVLGTNSQSKKPPLTDNKEHNAQQELPAVIKGEQLACEHLKLIDKLTSPPKHFTEGTLIKAMETVGSLVTDKNLKKVLRDTAGLGTQATRANIIQTLFQRKFIRQDKKLIKATTLGHELIEAVPDVIKDPILTAQWEQCLEDIATTTLDKSPLLMNDFLKQQIQLLEKILSNQVPSKLSTQFLPNSTTSFSSTKLASTVELATTTEVAAKDKKLIPMKATKVSPNTIVFNKGDQCPSCGQTLELRQAIRGKKIGMDYIGCTNFPECRFYFWPKD